MGLTDLFSNRRVSLHISLDAFRQNIVWKFIFLPPHILHFYSTFFLFFNLNAANSMHCHDANCYIITNLMHYSLFLFRTYPT